MSFDLRLGFTGPKFLSRRYTVSIMPLRGSSRIVYSEELKQLEKRLWNGNSLLVMNVRLYFVEEIVHENLILSTFTKSRNIICSSNALIKLISVLLLLLLRKPLGLISLSVSAGAGQTIFCVV